MELLNKLYILPLFDTAEIFQPPFPLTYYNNQIFYFAIELRITGTMQHKLSDFDG